MKSLNPAGVCMSSSHVPTVTGQARRRGKRRAKTSSDQSAVYLADPESEREVRVAADSDKKDRHGRIVIDTRVAVNALARAHALRVDVVSREVGGVLCFVPQGIPYLSDRYLEFRKLTPSLSSASGRLYLEFRKLTPFLSSASGRLARCGSCGFDCFRQVFGEYLRIELEEEDEPVPEVDFEAYRRTLAENWPSLNEVWITWGHKGVCWRIERGFVPDAKLNLRLID